MYFECCRNSLISEISQLLLQMDGNIKRTIFYTIFLLEFHRDFFSFLYKSNFSFRGFSWEWNSPITVTRKFPLHNRKFSTQLLLQREFFIEKGYLREKPSLKRCAITDTEVWYHISQGRNRHTWSISCLGNTKENFWWWWWLREASLPSESGLSQHLKVLRFGWVTKPSTGQPCQDKPTLQFPLLPHFPPPQSISGCTEADAGLRHEGQSSCLISWHLLHLKKISGLVLNTNFWQVVHAISSW